MAGDASLVEWLGRDFGLDHAVFGEETIQSALTARRRALGISDHDDYFRRWQVDSEEQSALLEGLLVGETWFFREPAAFDSLALWLQERRGQEPLRILTLPCATGEEAWSISAVLRSLGFGPQEVQVEAMDISAVAIETARQGVYPARRLRLTGPEPWYQQVTPKDGMITISAELKAMVRFMTANATDRESILRCRPYDVIFCRNMLIYMHDLARLNVLETLLMRLRPEGLLFLGHTELPPAQLGLIRASREGAFAWRRRSEADGGSAASPRLERGVMPSPGKAKPLSVATQKPVLVKAPRKVSEPSGLPPVSEASVHWKEARALADQGRLTEAYELVERLELDDALNPDLQCFAGVLLGALGRISESMTRFRRALYLDSQHSESLLHLILLLEEKGDVEAAKRLKSRLSDA